MSGFLKGFQHFALLIARLGLGGVMIAHAWYRWQISGIDTQIAYLTAHGVPYPQWVAWAAIIGEGIGGLFLIVGLLTPLVGLGFLVEQILIISWTRWYHFYVTAGGFEYELIIGVLSLVFLAFGAGKVSIDRVFRRSKNEPDGIDDRSPA
ncbi:MAG: DoxX family protein [Propionibacteriaceae bacterium]